MLLVGAMGLYEYRPYVRKIRNNRQIMFQCDRGFELVGGPTGATCIDGHWSPPQLPRYYIALNKVAKAVHGLKLAFPGDISHSPKSFFYCCHVTPLRGMTGLEGRNESIKSENFNKLKFFFSFRNQDH